MLGTHWASKVLPAPGEPIMMMPMIPTNCHLQRTFGRIMTDYVYEIEGIVTLLRLAETERGQYFARDLTQIFECEAFHP